MEWKSISLLLIGVIIGVGGLFFFNNSSLDKNISNLNTDSENQLETTIRNIKQNPKQFEGKTVTLTGRSNSLEDFIASGGYQIEMDCSDYPEFEYSSKFKADFVVEYIPGELGPGVRCVSAPKKISE